MRRICIYAAIIFLTSAGIASAHPPGGIPPTKPPVVVVTPPPTTQPTQPDTSGGLLGSPDTTQSLGMADASCAHNKTADAQVIENCAASGLAESAYPPANYGTDTHVDTGPLSFANDLASGIQTFIGGFFALLAHVLTWILEGLGLAFSFDLFAQGHNRIAHGIGNTLNLFTVPLLPIFIVLGGIVAFVYWGVHKAEGKAVTHVFAMVLLIALGFLIATNPVGMLGWLDQASNELTSGTFSAFTGHNATDTSGFADATPGIYKIAMEEPWCAMEFGSVNWCMARIDPTMAAARRSVLAHLPEALGDQGSKQLAKQEEPIERTRLNDARTNGELFLSFIPNSDARNGQNDSWTLYHALLQEHPELAAIRGAGGVWEHMVILFLACVAGLFFLLLLIYIAYQLVVASVFFIVCLFLTPVMIFAPAFGETGRAAFVKWLTWMGEALAKRIIFAAYLGIVLLTTNVFLQATNLGWGLQWLILGVIWAMGFHFRHRFLDLLTAGAYDSHHHPGAWARRWGTAAAMGYAWKRAPQKVAAVHEHHYGDEQSTHQHVHVYGSAYANEGPLRVDNQYGELEQLPAGVIESGENGSD